MNELNPYFQKLMAEMPPEAQLEIQQDPDLLQAMQGMSPEQLDALLKDYQGESQIIDTEMAMAEQLRNREGAQGINAGGQYVAASPLAHISKTANNIMADRQQREGVGKMGDLSGQKTDSMKSIADILRGAGSQGFSGFMNMFGG